MRIMLSAPASLDIRPQVHAALSRFADRVVGIHLVLLRRQGLSTCRIRVLCRDGSSWHVCCEDVRSRTALRRALARCRRHLERQAAVHRPVLDIARC
ncbi:MAG: hypothetical protein ACOCXJ_07840 [Planctomycetota bacterium]